MKEKIGSLILAMGLSSCAILHHVQVGQVDNRNGATGTPFTVMVSETGVNLQEAGRIAKATHTQAGRDANEVTKIIGLFQMGPRTGNPVYNEHYADNILDQIYSQCPTGRITNLMSIRETWKYPVISGEIVKVTGICMNGPVATNQGAKK